MPVAGAPTPFLHGLAHNQYTRLMLLIQSLTLMVTSLKRHRRAKQFLGKTAGAGQGSGHTSTAMSTVQGRQRLEHPRNARSPQPLFATRTAPECYVRWKKELIARQAVPTIKRRKCSLSPTTTATRKKGCNVKPCATMASTPKETVQQVQSGTAQQLQQEQPARQHINNRR